jgi:PIN domain nuclease of toxin-antitoxin system
MRLLLDTHVAVWAVAQRERLSAETLSLIADPTNDVCVSVVSLWEVGIKFALGRPGDPMPFSATEAHQWFEQARFRTFPVEARHATAVDRLPAIHTDPFDRLLVAQAMAEPMALLTRDARLAGYSELVTLV